jgi:hypothetical protein
MRPYPRFSHLNKKIKENNKRRRYWVCSFCCSSIEPRNLTIIIFNLGFLLLHPKKFNNKCTFFSSHEIVAPPTTTHTILYALSFARVLSTVVGSKRRRVAFSLLQTLTRGVMVVDYEVRSERLWCGGERPLIRRSLSTIRMMDRGRRVRDDCGKRDFCGEDDRHSWWLWGCKYGGDGV